MKGTSPNIIQKRLFLKLKSLEIIELYLNYAPNFEKVGDILVSACPYVCVNVCMYSCSRYPLETSWMDSSWINSRRIFLVFPELSPLVKLRPFDKLGYEIL